MVADCLAKCFGISSDIRSSKTTEMSLTKEFRAHLHVRNSFA